MFSTPRTTPSNSRRALGFTRASSSQHTTSGQGTSESSGQNVDQNNSNEDVLSVLRSLQQQVSTIQAQQNRDRTERRSTSTPSPSSSLNDKRKLPKELTVGYTMLCLLLFTWTFVLGSSPPNCQAITRSAGK